ncbi:hypothetical protein [uncultured Novosphingobium sp.]|uniref:hypothetical protein n=1 Tax=uncultured Novosphingobium sp. TaxID=292277 RepID=UPI000737AA74|nr:hypothetical protein [uncultured Novosphingobium sp.]KTR84424.1 hypothetical protein NS277_04490 [Novosphingobium barchaimii]
MEFIGVLVPLAPFMMVCFIVWTKHQRKLAEMQMANTAEKAAQYASHSRELEERIRVLERIVTDGGYDTALQIEALRDKREVEEQRGTARGAAIN